MGCRTTPAFVGLGIGSGQCCGGFAENSSIIATFLVELAGHSRTFVDRHRNKRTLLAHTVASWC
jgi:hypothetical protein